jgi:predicted dehydrogenase
MSSNNHQSRRKFLYSIGLGIGGVAITSFESDLNPFSNSSSNYFSKNNEKQLGIALVGLGKYSTGQLAPALLETKLCKLTGIVTGSSEKAKDWSSKYKIPDKNIYNYQNFDSIADNPEIDIVYVVLPVSMHAEYTIRAAKAGKHVICEKPMALNVEECEKIISACNEAKRKLFIGYRLHFEPYNLEMMRLGQESSLGPVQKLEAQNGFDVGEPDQWRLKKSMAGGGSLMDVGIYCIQGVRYILGKEPIAVTAKIEPSSDIRFKEVEDTIKWEMEFEGGINSNCISSYSKEFNKLRAEASKGWFELSPAFQYNGIQGRTSQGRLTFPQVNQQALQMDSFADCILNDKQNKAPGEDGMQDIKIIRSIYEAALSGKKITL